MTETQMLELAPVGTRLYIVTHHDAFRGEVIAEHQTSDPRDPSGRGVVTRSLACLTRTEVDQLWSTMGIQSVTPAMPGSIFDDDTEGAVRIYSSTGWEILPASID